MLVFLNIVITSYSIHYTKLYEVDLTKVDDDEICVINPKTNLLSAEAFVEEINRITSYNVCYTKLLRNTFIEKNSEKKLLVTFYGINIEDRLRYLITTKYPNVITSYSIHYTKLYE